MTNLNKLLKNPETRQAVLDEIIAESSRQSLRGYTRALWHVLEPQSRTLVDSWALGAVCEHLEAVTHGQIRRLVINVPPGMTKSMLTRVFWPTWEWGPQGLSHVRTVGASYHGQLAIRDNRRARILIESERFQRLWPHIQLAHDQYGNMRFSNTEHGFMLATSVEGLGTGERGDRFVIDDPHNVQQGESEKKRQGTVFWFHEVVPTRVIDADQSAIVIIMQRVHEKDVAAAALELGYEHLMLPMRFEEERRCTTSIGFTDPRTTEGELLAPDRYSQRATDELEQAIGSFATASQLQQRPAPRGGNVIKVANLELQSKPSEHVVRKRVRCWDKAGTEDGGDWTAGTLMAEVAHPDGLYYLVEDVVRGQWTAGARERIIRQTAETDGPEVSIVVEQEPGSGGKESAQSTIRNLAGFAARKEIKSVDKEQNADPFASAVENGLVRYVQGEWNKDWLDELRHFPAGANDDQVDATAGAYNALTSKRRAGALF